MMTGQSTDHLIIKGSPKREQLEAAWIEIKSEYSDLLKTEKSINILELWKKIEFTQLKIDLLFICLNQLKFKFDSEIAGIVMTLGYDQIVELKDETAYLKSIEAVETDSKTLHVLLNQYINEYNLATPKESHIERTEMDYEKDLVVLSKFMGSKINKKESTVFEVVAIFNSFLEEQNLIKNHGRKTAI